MAKRLRHILAETVPSRCLADVYNSYDIVGDIAIIRLTEASATFSLEIADALMEVHKNVKTVLAQRDGVRGDFRLRKLEFVKGEDKTTTIHNEWTCLFSVDLKNCYFSPRLSFERMRIAKQIKQGEIVLNMFAGVGCFSVIMTRYSNVDKVYSVDINPCAVQYMRDNIGMNKMGGRVFPLLGDAKSVVQTRLFRRVDRVLMPLPEKAFEYLPFALMALKETGGWIHHYDFVYAKKKDDAFRKIMLRVSERLRSLKASYDFSSGRIVRSTGPHWHQIAIDIKVDKCGTSIQGD